MEPDFNKLEKEVLKAAIKAEDEAVVIQNLNVDNSWKKISKRLKLNDTRESIFSRVSKFIDVNWGVGYGAQTSILTFSFLVFGVFIGVGVDLYDVTGYSQHSNSIVMRGSNNQSADMSYKVLKVQVDNPISYIKKIVEYAISNNVDFEVKHEIEGRSITLRNLKEMDVDQSSLKAFLEIPNSQSGTLKIYVQSK